VIEVTPQLDPFIVQILVVLCLLDTGLIIARIGEAQAVQASLGSLHG
jgi:hypothetical protein